MQYIEKLQKKLNNLCEIRPEIFVRFGRHDTVIIGSTVLLKKKTYIEIDVPYDCILTEATQLSLMCILIHEYCHYFEDSWMTQKKRTENIKEYANNATYRRSDEQRTWTATKHLAKCIGVWDKTFYAEIKSKHFAASLRF